jgi:hypothetical protein
MRFVRWARRNAGGADAEEATGERETANFVVRAIGGVVAEDAPESLRRARRCVATRHRRVVVVSLDAAELSGPARARRAAADVSTSGPNLGLGALHTAVRTERTTCGESEKRHDEQQPTVHQ